MEFSSELLTILFLVGVVAGTIDTIAGGGGLLTIPALMYAGLPPAAALATNKMQSVFGTFTASYYFIRKGLVDISQMKLMIAMAFIGSVAGGFTLIQIDASILEKIIPILLIAIGIYFLLAKNAGAVEKHKLISTALFAFSFVFVIGFYDGFFGPGTGSFFTMALIFFLGLNIATATAQTKVLNLTTNLASFLFFLVFGEIYFLIGLIMGIGQILGALLGAKLVMLKGQKLIRPLIVIISFSMSIKLLLG
jgi:uncharacterized membrane protein YfcA